MIIYLCIGKITKIFFIYDRISILLDDGNINIRVNVRDFYRDAKKFYKPINLNLNFDLEYNFTRNVAVNFKYIL